MIQDVTHMVPICVCPGWSCVLCVFAAQHKAFDDAHYMHRFRLHRRAPEARFGLFQVVVIISPHSFPRRPTFGHQSVCHPFGWCTLRSAIRFVAETVDNLVIQPLQVISPS
uniref:Uncharacterized protein n=1 Tax=Eutreptiella gymnastica TaxID=73025 RepID=A0A7S1IA95_9EUGL|mmetsp:Transcript_142401/g.248352  ORF Transcript_142401/g.248352 Transcript_142401/m.248352 type:complete len:111 (+) Transcript_142401:91-423(+)